MTPPDDAPQTGQRVYRFISDHAVCFSASRMLSGDEPGVWHSLDPKALAEMQRIGTAIIADPSLSPAMCMATILETFGLTPPEPKEGGASA